MVSVEICENPIFIIGSPRSGTTALAWALAQHSQLWTSDESQILWDLFGDGRLEKNYKRRKGPDEGWLLKRGIGRSEFLKYVGLGFNALFTEQSQGLRWVDQTPNYTLFAETLVEMFPGSVFIHILRDGRRVVNSMVHYLDRNRPDPSRQARKALPPAGPAWALDFRVACATWSRFVRAALEFNSQHPGRCVTVVNERLVKETEPGFRKIFGAIGVPYEEDVVDYFRSNRINSSFVSDASRGTALQTLTEPWDGWDDERRQIFLEEAGETLVEACLATAGEIDRLRRGGEIRRAVERHLPRDAGLILIGDDEPEWRDLSGRRVCRLSGPGDDAATLARLEELRSQGCDYVVVPGPAPFAEAGRHLEPRYRPLYRDDFCLIYHLAEQGGANPS